MAKHFTVIADPTTGEWLTEPEYQGEVSFNEFESRPDTHEKLHDTFEREGETCAVTVIWTET